jgi:PAS domain S-box-containing protein
LLEAQIDALGWAFRSSSDLVLVATADGAIVPVNPAARQRWPTSGDDPDARALLPDDLVVGLKAAVAAVAKTGAAESFEWGDRHPGGIRSWFKCTVSALVDADDVARAHLCVSSDVTELKRSEERLRRSEQLMVDTQGVAHLGTWEWDVSEPHATWSAELYSIYGLTPESYTPSYEKYLTMVHAEDRDRVRSATERVFREHVPYSHDERIFRPDGSMRYLHTWASPVLDKDGQLIRLVGVCQDITDQKRAEEEVQEMNASLERRVAERTLTIESSLRDVEAFNAIASHDLRAPLSVIQGSCTILQQSPDLLPGRVTENLARIQRAATQMTSLINDLLKLAQVGSASLSLVDVDLTAMCEDVVAQLRRSSNAERDVVVDVRPGLQARCDPTLMRAALENLIGNAWKYSSRVEHARIEIGVTVAEVERVFFVRDNGAGFDMKDASRLFTPFQRLHNASEFEGTGIGLTAVQRIIERHGGRIWAEAHLGRGATFLFQLTPSPEASGET